MAPCLGREQGPVLGRVIPALDGRGGPVVAAVENVAGDARRTRSGPLQQSICAAPFSPPSGALRVRLGTLGRLAEQALGVGLGRDRPAQLERRGALRTVHGCADCPSLCVARSGCGERLQGCGETVLEGRGLALGPSPTLGRRLGCGLAAPLDLGMGTGCVAPPLLGLGMGCLATLTLGMGLGSAESTGLLGRAQDAR